MASQEAKMESCQIAIGYCFSDRKLLWEALQAAELPVLISDGGYHVDGNKKLAVLRDAVLRLVLVKDGYSGNKTRELNKNPSQGSVVSFNTMTATVKALLGAVFLDSDIDHVAQVMRNIGLTA
ncbi:hypothetical protein BU16DRAFT_623017 [Lophium mytilinum]|uniref:RNase III domain-containing protein n=1 Tax=Lophium mytilinum TaxID=390894 RepID=A0A6A6QAN1_9PEZI|nr:hypothetical protein BU16DRAFT_623017 [Lophium mytilinum]